MMIKEFIKKFLFLFAFMTSAGIFAQKVTGVVTSDDGPLPGATVLVQGTNEFATTDFDGNFSIEANQGDILIVSFVGYQTQEVAVDGDDLTITMSLGNLLDEVIVTTGYGTQSKRDITGAVSTIEADELTAVPATTFSQQMQGRASGISIVSDATPGGEATVRIRGFGSIGNNNPLYVIDGVIVETGAVSDRSNGVGFMDDGGGNLLSTINPKLVWRVFGNRLRGEISRSDFFNHQVRC